MQRSLNVVLDDGYLPPPVSDREPKNTTILTLDGSVHDRWDDLPASA